MQQLLFRTGTTWAHVQNTFSFIEGFLSYDWFFKWFRRTDVVTKVSNQTWRNTARLRPAAQHKYPAERRLPPRIVWPLQHSKAVGPPPTSVALQGHMTVFKEHETQYSQCPEFKHAGEVKAGSRMDASVWFWVSHGESEYAAHSGNTCVTCWKISPERNPEVLLFKTRTKINANAVKLPLQSDFQRKPLSVLLFFLPFLTPTRQKHSTLDAFTLGLFVNAHLNFDADQTISQRNSSLLDWEAFYSLASELWCDSLQCECWQTVQKIKEQK